MLSMQSVWAGACHMMNGCSSGSNNKQLMSDLMLGPPASARLP